MERNNSQRSNPPIFPRSVSKREIWERTKEMDSNALPGIKNLATHIGSVFGVARIDLKTEDEHVFWEDNR